MTKGPLQQPPPLPAPWQCFECGAVLRNERQCWLCGAQQPVMGKLIQSPVEGPANPWITHGTIWLAIITALMVGYGILRTGDYFIATLFAIVVVPTVLIVMGASAVSRAAGKPMGTGAKVGVAVTAFSTTLAIVAIVALIAVLMVIAMVIAMFQDCFRMLGGH